MHLIEMDGEENNQITKECVANTKQCELDATDGIRSMQTSL